MDDQSFDSIMQAITSGLTNDPNTTFPTSRSSSRRTRTIPWDKRYFAHAEGSSGA